VTDNRPTEDLEQVPPPSTERPTVELEPMPTVHKHRYSVRRATTDDERSQLVERISVGRVATPPPKPHWRVEVGDRTVTIRNDTMQIELPMDDARKIAEAILRGR
jgi:hypothetical protein